MSSSEFVRWKAWLNNKWTRRTPDQYYLAQIAMQVHLQKARKGTKAKIRDFLVKFSFKGQQKPKDVAKDAMTRAAESRKVWLGAAGIKPDKEA